MSSSANLSPEEARELVQRITKDYGWISRSDREQTPVRVQRVIENLRRELGASTRTLAKNLYRSQARFVFELIQNADDNRYKRAKDAGATPYINFHVYQDKIIVDSNEDGFTAENVKSICRINASTKIRTELQHYIGEKGIGFKSVFMVASKVAIQSGPFSFFFEHEPGDSGMGMITPEYFEPEEGLRKPLTRMTLTLLDTLDHADLLSQFDALPDTLLLFVINLRSIKVAKYGPAGELLDSTIYSCDIDDVRRHARLLKICGRRNEPPEETSGYYHVTRKTLYNLPKDEQRDFNTAEVVLAFPLDSDNVPVIKRQDVYAYLPIRDFGFNFLIQSDFVTQASRQDVMETPRNRALLDGIAETFVDAVFQFCEHPSLQYQWVRYIPQEIPEAFWARLEQKIKALLKTRPILRPRSKGSLKLISQLKVLLGMHLDRHGNPLIADLPEEIYLASEYEQFGCTGSLQKLGLRIISMDEMCARFQQDISSSWSVLKSPDTDEDWHTRAARLLLLPFKWEEERLLAQLRRMQMIPLVDGTWTSILDGEVFFPDTDGIQIPTDIELHIVDRKAINNGERKKLLTSLGVANASSKVIRQQILERYLNSSGAADLESSIAHLRYLYNTHIQDEKIVANSRSSSSSPSLKLAPMNESSPVSSLPPVSVEYYRQYARASSKKENHGTRRIRFKVTVENEPNSRGGQQNAFQSIHFQSEYQNYSSEELRLTDYTRGLRFGDPSGTFGLRLSNFESKRNSIYRGVWLFDHEQTKVSLDNDIYFHSHGTFSVYELLKQTMATSAEKGESAPGLFVSFINPKYLASIKSCDRDGHPSFQVWLEYALGVLPRPRLIDLEFPMQLSHIFLYIAKHRRNLLLGTLKAHWNAYSSLMTTEIALKISELEVPCSNSNLRLEKTFLPLKMLEECCRQFLSVEFFPFLHLDIQPEDEWRFLEIFGVGVNNDIHFYLTLLKCCVSTSQGDIYKIYEAIQHKCWNSPDASKNRELVRELFENESLIRVPTTQESSPDMVKASECVWEGPAYLTCKVPLLLSLSEINNTILTEFFRNTLQIRNADYMDLVYELDMLSYKEETDEEETEDDSGEGIEEEKADEDGSHQEDSDEEQSNEQDVEPDPAIIRDLYQRLDSLRPQLDQFDLKWIQNDFEKDPKIYVLPEKRWYAPSSCLWTTKTGIKNKAIISEQYSDLKDFFVGFLRVKVPDLDMLAKELKQSVDSNPSIEDIRSLIWQINATSPTGKALEILLESPIFPTRKGNGEFELRKRSDGFAINDRQKLADAFDVVIVFFDFSLEEVCRLQPFLSCFNIEDHYLSQVVVEKSKFEGDPQSPSRTLTRHLRQRAHALFRCATHFRSPRTQDEDRSLYQLLLRSNVFETNEITSQLEYTQNGKKTVVDVEKSSLYIKEQTESLKIYVPKDAEDQELCYLRLLPPKLFGLLMKEVSGALPKKIDVAAVSIIADVLKSSDRVLRGVLDEAGIIPVSFPDEFRDDIPEFTCADNEVGSSSDAPLDTDDRAYESTSSGTERRTSTTAASWSSMRSDRSSPSWSRQISYGSGVRTNSGEPRVRPFTVLRSGQTFSNSDISRSLFSDDGSEGEYRRLLDSVIQAARNKRGAFPSRGVFDFHDMASALSMDPSESATYEMPFGVRTENQLAHDMKIGAAGELYAFEILSRLETSIPGFNRQNWASTIRKYVTVHDNYRDMEPWRGTETADITYNDTQGKFTKLLIDNGYLDKTVWTGARPNYFLEVKSTTGEYGSRFFLSKSQYQRMQRMKLAEGQMAPEVYVILRVFKLDKDGIDMKAYLDPAGMEEREELVFRAESYSVVPGWG